MKKLITIFTLIIFVLLFAANTYAENTPRPIVKKHGVYLAKVVNNSDPEGLLRVKVKLLGSLRPIPHWAKTISHGGLAVYNIETEVLVSFINGDPRSPVVLGKVQN